MAPAMPSCFSTTESSQRDVTEATVAEDSDRHLRSRRSPPLASAARGLAAAVRSRREIFARHLRMTSRDGTRLQVCSASRCSSSSVARGGETTNGRSEHVLLKLLRAKLLRRPLELRAKLGRP
jgi:hypothetical protein